MSKFLYNSSMPRRNHKEYVSHKATALELATRKANHFCAVYGCHYNRVSIRNQKTMWGSCSRKGNLNFNYKILLLPERFQDYVIVHEICHLREFNHSPRFWALVAQTIPEHQKIRSELRRKHFFAMSIAAAAG